MPQFARVNSNLAGWADLASNSGNYATARDQQDYGLRLDQVDEQRRNHDEIIKRYDEDRQARRDIAAGGIDSRERTAADRLDAGWDKAVMQQGGMTARSTAGIQSREGVAAMNRDSREGIAEGNQAKGYYGIDQRAEQAQLSREQQAEIARANREHAEQLANAKATHAAALADKRLDAQTRQRVIDRNIQEYQQQRRIIEGRIRDIRAGGQQPTWEYGREGELNDAIAGANAPPPAVPQAPPAPAGNYQNPAGVATLPPFYPGEGDPAQGQQPAPRTATNAQTGQRLYFDEASQQWVPIQ